MSRFTIPADHPSLPGHFPGRPIVPGVVLLDEAFAVLRIEPQSLAAVRFTHPVRPGDVVEVTRDGARFEARVDGALVLQGTLGPGA